MEEAIDELRQFLKEVKENTFAEYPLLRSSKWDGFISGIEMAIHILELKAEINEQ